MEHPRPIRSSLAGAGPATGEPVHLSIHGRVQGVGFRDSLILQALHRGVDGWVRNRRDGSVEAVLQGNADAVAALIRWAQLGPATAHVERVDTRPADAGEITTLQPGFRRLPTA
jgi:acylphosphatase